MSRLLVLLVALSPLLPGQVGAKTMFYDPAGVGTGGKEASAANATRLRQILWARPFPQFGYVGIHYWFEDARGHPLSETTAAQSTEPVTLRIRGNVDAFLTMWSVGGEGEELTPREHPRWSGYLMRTEPFVVPRKLRFVSGDKAARFVVVFGRSQTEMASSRDSALDRLRDLGSRIGKDGTPQILREVDDATPGEIGTYVVNRQGSPLAAEIVLRAR